jgi:ParB family chromosome partitioning protein
VKRSGLGRGLDSLIPSQTRVSEDSALRDIPVSDVVPNSRQPRQEFDEETLASLAASIREIGVLQPILVQEADQGYELIAGERRLRAAKRAGLLTIPAIVVTTDSKGSLERALVENLHRQDLNPVEEASGYAQLIEEFGLTHEEVAKRVGKSRAAVSNAIRLLQLPPEVQRLLKNGQITAGHARALLATPDRALQEQLAGRIVRESLNVREVEELVKSKEGQRLPEVSAVAAIKEPATRMRPPGVLELEEILGEKLNTTVRVEMGPKKGRVTIEFADLEDLERIYRLMFA